MSKYKYEGFGVIRNTETDFTYHTDDIAELLEEKDQQIADLEAKLAEKDKEIEKLKKFDDLNKTFFDLFRTAFKEPDKVDDLFNILKTIQEKQDQDKISFALEQLEKVKEKINDCPITDYDTNKHFVKMYQSDAIRQLDNQIKQLKEQ